MEYYSYLKAFGRQIKQIRKEMKMNQCEFYDYLFPELATSDENKKKKINAIEKAKQKRIDCEIMLKLCEKKDLSADFLLGIKEDYTLAFICEYTGLSEKSVKQLHKWCMAANNGADVSKIDDVYFGDDAEEQYQKARDKQDALQFLRIINYLFTEGTYANPKHQGRNEPYSNLSIFTCLYLLCMAKPETIQAYLSQESLERNMHLFAFNVEDVTKELMSIDVQRGLYLQDNRKVWYYIDTKQYIEQYARKQLDEGIKRLITQVKREEEKINRTITAERQEP